MRTQVQELDNFDELPYHLLLAVFSCSSHLAFLGQFSWL